MITFISGGARSGKSSYAEAVVLKQAAAPIYVATGSRSDEEMIQRIEQHQQERPLQFITKEAGFHVKDVLLAAASGEVLLVDCVTVWLNEAMFQQQKTSIEIMTVIEEWCLLITERELHVTFVSNDLNEGGLPLNKETQEYTALLEKIHRKLILHADTVIQVKAGLPRFWKGAPYEKCN